MRFKLNSWKNGFAAILLGCLVIVSACKREFDAPPEFTEPAIAGQVNYSIDALKEWYSDTLAAGSGGALFIPARGWIIEGLVNADDKSGNYYKQISIQDVKGGVLSGITIRLDRNNLYADFPVGRKVYIKLDGLAIGAYGGLVQLGGSVDNTDPDPSRWNVFALSSDLIDTYVVKGSTGNPVEATLVTEATLNETFQSVLVKMENSEFRASDTSKTYAVTTPTPASANLYLKGCTGKEIIVRTSGYSTFAAAKVPGGNGTITAIYTIFNATKQLVLRDTSDVRLTGPRCGSGPVTGTLINTSDLRALFTGSPTTVPADKKITGIVITDRIGSNITNKNMVVQQGNGLAGILVRFTDVNGLDLGDSVDITVSGMELSEFNGLLQLNNVPNGNAVKLSGGKSITPRSTTIADLNANFETWESTLVKFTGVTLSPAGTWNGVSGNTTVTQGANSMAHYTTSFATFKGDVMPTGSVDMTAVVSQAGTTQVKQLSIRNPTDVTGGSGPVGTILINENFESIATTGDFALAGWQNIGETGGVKYQGKTFSSNKYPQITAFGSAQAIVKSWLITPPLNFNTTTGEILTFNTNDGYDNGATLKVYYSTDYTGGATPSTATWTPLTATISSGHAAGYGTFIPSGDVSMGMLTGAAVYIAFVYEGGEPGKTTTFQVDNVKVVGD